MTEFFDEVEEQLRSEKYRTLVTRGWPWALGVVIAALVVALGVWGFQSYRAHQAAAASEDYAVALESLQKGDTAKAFDQFQTVVPHRRKGYEALSLMQQGAIRLGEDKDEQAVALFDKAAKVAPDEVVGDMARLKSAFALMDTAPYAAMEERLKPLTDAKRPYAAAAREALAMAKLKAGRLKDARSDFSVLTLLPDVPEGMRQRAQLAIAAIDDGSAVRVPAAVQAELKLPPSQITPRRARRDPPPNPEPPNEGEDPARGGRRRGARRRRDRLRHRVEDQSLPRQGREGQGQRGRAHPPDRLQPEAGSLRHPEGDAVLPARSPAGDGLAPAERHAGPLGREPRRRQGLPRRLAAEHRRRLQPPRPRHRLARGRGRRGVRDGRRGARLGRRRLVRRADLARGPGRALQARPRGVRRRPGLRQRPGLRDFRLSLRRGAGRQERQGLVAHGGGFADPRRPGGDPGPRPRRQHRRRAGILQHRHRRAGLDLPEPDRAGPHP